MSKKRIKLINTSIIVLAILLINFGVPSNSFAKISTENQNETIRSIVKNNNKLLIKNLRAEEKKKVRAAQDEFQEEKKVALEKYKRTLAKSADKHDRVVARKQFRNDIIKAQVVLNDLKIDAKKIYLQQTKNLLILKKQFN